MKIVTKFISIALILFTSITVVAQNRTCERVKLKKNKSAGMYILTQEMVAKPSTSYVIRYAYDLAGKTIVIPEGCNLIFKRKGSISNGEIVFKDTWLKNEKFFNITSAKGTLLNTEFEASRYGFVDDTDKLLFLFNQAKDGFILKLEPGIIYNVNTLKGVSRVRYDSAFAAFKDVADISILGNNTIIRDSADKSLIRNYLYSVLQFDSCSNVNVRGISYIWTEQATLHPKVEGIVFLRTFNECINFDIEVSVFNAGRGVYSGRRNDNTDPGRGICDSKLYIIADHVGYPIAIEKGDNLSINNFFSFAHRGTYLAGVTNSNILVEGKEAYSTRVNLLLTDTSDANGCYFCDGIKATVIDTGSEEMMNSVIMAQCNTYPQSDIQFKGRDPYDVKSIEIAIFTPEGSTTSFEGLLYSDMAQIGDKMNITVTGVMADNGENSRLTRLNNVPNGNIVYKSIQSSRNYVIINSDIPDGGNIVFEECPNLVLSLSSQRKRTMGSISFKGCSFHRFLKKDLAGTGFFPNLVLDE